MSKNVTRRQILKYGGGAFVIAASSQLGAHPASGAADLKTQQVAGFYRFKLGEFEVTVLSDGAYSLPTDLMAANQPVEKIKAFLKANLLDTEKRLSHVNIPLINTGSELILVDVGGGSNFLNGAGNLVANMMASGYQPDDVDKVIITHGHPDHIWGLIDDFDEPTFPNASYVLAQKEWDFWATDAARNTLAEEFQPMAAGASRRLPLIDEKAERVEKEQELSSGIYALETPGHTPGHMSLVVKSGGDQLLVTADAVTHPFISFEHPDWWPRTDADPKKAETSRRKILQMAADDQMLVLCYHVSFPGLGRVARKGTAYRWVPETWQWKL